MQSGGHYSRIAGKFKVYLFYYMFLKWIYNMLERDESQWHSLDEFRNAVPQEANDAVWGLC